MVISNDTKIFDKIQHTCMIKKMHSKLAIAEIFLNLMKRIYKKSTANNILHC
jgi:hypothetical protein